MKKIYHHKISWHRSCIIRGSDVRVGNKIIGLASSGLHSNGFSLVRKIIFEDLGLSVDDSVEELGCTIGEELIKPTRIYVRSVLGVLNRFALHSLVHNTGGGFIDNIPRVLPKGCQAVIEKESWEKPPIFSFLQEKGEVPEAEMYRTFNMGVGMMAVVKDADADAVMQHFKAMGEEPFVIGEILAAQEGEPRVLINGLEEN
ncbi:MAG: hypothetical protein D3908_12590 [Candidatus Electrothrix sp. AUS4]|nr:hypothetical protein [Candidatus Electrothrix sp. AUS4]